MFGLICKRERKSLRNESTLLVPVLAIAPPANMNGVLLFLLNSNVPMTGGRDQIRLRKIGSGSSPTWSAIPPFKDQRCLRSYVSVTPIAIAQRKYGHCNVILLSGVRCMDQNERLFLSNSTFPVSVLNPILRIWRILASPLRAKPLLICSISWC